MDKKQTEKIIKQTETLANADAHPKWQCLRSAVLRSTKDQGHSAILLVKSRFPPQYFCLLNAWGSLKCLVLISLQLSFCLGGKGLSWAQCINYISQCKSFFILNPGRTHVKTRKHMFGGHDRLITLQFMNNFNFIICWTFHRKFVSQCLCSGRCFAQTNSSDFLEQTNSRLSACDIRF